MDLELLRPHSEIELNKDTDFGDIVELAPEIAEILDERYETFATTPRSGATVEQIAEALGRPTEDFLRELYEVISAP